MQPLHDHGLPYGGRAVLSRLHFLLAAIFGPDVLLPGPVPVPARDGEVLHADLVLLEKPPRLDTRLYLSPPLVFEIFPPGVAEAMRKPRAQVWLGAGVREVWILDVVRAEIEVHDGGGVRVGLGDPRIHSRAFPAIALVPRRIFAPPKAW